MPLKTSLPKKGLKGCYHSACNNALLTKISSSKVPHSKLAAQFNDGSKLGSLSPHPGKSLKSRNYLNTEATQKIRTRLKREGPSVKDSRSDCRLTGNGYAMLSNLKEAAQEFPVLQELINFVDEIETVRGKFDNVQARQEMHLGTTNSKNIYCHDCKAAMMTVVPENTPQDTGCFAALAAQDMVQSEKNYDYMSAKSQETTEESSFLNPLMLEGCKNCAGVDSDQSFSDESLICKGITPFQCELSDRKLLVPTSSIVTSAKPRLEELLQTAFLTESRDKALFSPQIAAPEFGALERDQVFMRANMIYESLHTKQICSATCVTKALPEPDDPRCCSREAAGQLSRHEDMLSSNIPTVLDHNRESALTMLREEGTWRTKDKENHESCSCSHSNVSSLPKDSVNMGCRNMSKKSTSQNIHVVEKCSFQCQEDGKIDAVQHIPIPHVHPKFGATTLQNLPYRRRWPSILPISAISSMHCQEDVPLDRSSVPSVGDNMVSAQTLLSCPTEKAVRTHRFAEEIQWRESTAKILPATLTIKKETGGSGTRFAQRTAKLCMKGAPSLFDSEQNPNLFSEKIPSQRLENAAIDEDKQINVQIFVSGRHKEEHVHDIEAETLNVAVTKLQIDCDTATSADVPSSFETPPHPLLTATDMSQQECTQTKSVQPGVVLGNISNSNEGVLTDEYSTKQLVMESSCTAAFSENSILERASLSSEKLLAILSYLGQAEQSNLPNFSHSTLKGPSYNRMGYHSPQSVLEQDDNISLADSCTSTTMSNKSALETSLNLPEAEVGCTPSLAVSVFNGVRKKMQELKDTVAVHEACISQLVLEKERLEVDKEKELSLEREKHARDLECRASEYSAAIEHHLSLKEKMLKDTQLLTEKCCNLGGILTNAETKVLTASSISQYEV